MEIKTESKEKDFFFFCNIVVAQISYLTLSAMLLEG